MSDKKKLKIAFIIGIALVIIGPIFGLTLSKIVIESRGADNPFIISENSASSIRESYHKEIKLERNQIAVIEFSVYYQNVSATLIILGKGTYDQQYALDNAPPGSGLGFVYSEFSYGQTPSSSATSATSVTINNDGYWYIEFAGDAPAFSNRLISIPGTYEIIVYGTNIGPPSETNVIFNLIIKIDGPGAFLQMLFLIVGILVLICCAFLVSYSYINTLRRGV